MKRRIKRLLLRLATHYLRRYAGDATRDGVEDGGYIVWMDATDYHRYTVLVQDRTQQDFHTIVWAARERGLEI